MPEPQVLSMEQVDVLDSVYLPRDATSRDILNLIATVRVKEAECAAMREALERYQFTLRGCPSCGAYSTEGHRENCSLAKFLSSTAGAQWLERYKAMERLYREILLFEVPADIDAILRELEAMDDGNTL